MNRIERVVCASALVCLVGAIQASLSKPQEPSKIKMSTDLVVVPVIVHKGGAHLTGLPKESFELLEDGKPMRIAVFDEVHASSHSEVVRPAEGEFTNARYGNSAQRLTVIAVDLVNTAPLDQAYLKQELIKFLDEAPESEQYYALVAMTTHGIAVLRDLTSDPKVISAALRRKNIQPNGREAPGSTGSATFDQTPCAASTLGCGSRRLNEEVGWKELQQWLTLYDVQESVDVFRDWNQHLDTLSSLQQIAQWLSGVPGRKTLIWAGSGVQLYGGLTRVLAGSGPKRNYSTIDYRNAAQASEENTYTFNMLSRANVAVYPLDARHGANTSFAVFDSSRTDAPIGQGAFAGQKGVVQNQDQEIIAMFQQIAANTGGKACFNRTDLSKCMSEFSSDSRDYYMLGFYVDKETKPGWHTLNVKLDQKAEIRHRKGFEMETPGKAPSASDFQLALSSPLPYTEIQFHGKFTNIEGTSGKRRVHFALDLAPETISLGERENLLKLEIVALVREIDGKQVANVSQRIDRKLDPSQAELIRTEGIHYTNRLEVATGSYAVWFAVRDGNSGQAGSVVTKLTVQ
jgi:VWFA-related protein